MSKNTNLSFLTDFLTADIVNSRVGMNNVSPQATFDVTGTGKFSGILTLGSTLSNGTYTYTLPSATGTLALTSDIPSVSGYVPYTGATQAVNLGYNQLLASTLSINGESLTGGSYLGFKHSTSVNTGNNGYTSIYTFGTNLIGFKSISGATTKDFSFSMVGITPGVPGGRIYTLPDADGTLALTSNLSAYLPLTGGTLTGALNGTSATFSSTLGVTGAATFSSSVGVGNVTPYSILSLPSGNGWNGGLSWNFIASGAGSRRWWINTDQIEFGDFRICTEKTQGGGTISNPSTLNERLYINAAGNVGIGTASPFSTLVVSNGSNENIEFVTGSSVLNGGVIEYINRTSGTTRPDLNIYNGSSNGSVKIYTQGTERMLITSGGVVKAKGTESTYHNINASYHELRTGQGGQFTAAISNTAGSPFGLLIDYNSAPNNSTSEFLYCTDGIVSTLRAAIRSDGGLANYQANNLNLSDERTKKEINPLESYWNKFKAIEIVKFKYKDQTHDDYNIGVIAQQVEAVAPEFVDIDGWDTKPKLDEDGNEIVSEEEPLKSIYTADLYHATIKVLQEAMAKIEKLETQIDSLKNQMQ